MPAQSALGIVEIQVSFKIGTIALISVLLYVVLQMASLKLALLFLIIDVSWVAHAVKGTRMFITNVFLLMQAFKMIRQEKLKPVHISTTSAVTGAVT